MRNDILPADQGTPPQLSIALVSNLPAGRVSDDVKEACDTAELVIALGNVDLRTLADALHPKKAALCVLGDQDRPVAPPAPFRALHGNALAYKNWRIAGLSGSSRRQAVGSRGMHITEDEAQMLLRKLPPADIIISHTPPAGLPRVEGDNSPDVGLEALAEYIDAALPAYCFFASAGQRDVQAFEWEDDEASTLVVGVGGLYVPPAIAYF